MSYFYGFHGKLIIWAYFKILENAEAVNTLI